MESYTFRYLFFMHEKQMLDALMKIRPRDADSLNRFFNVDFMEEAIARENNQNQNDSGALQTQIQPSVRAAQVESDVGLNDQHQKNATLSKSEELVNSNIGKQSLDTGVQLQKEDICFQEEINDDKNVLLHYNSLLKSDDCDRD